MTEQLDREEMRLLDCLREAKKHGYAEIHITIHEHQVTVMTMSKKEHFRLQGKLREV